MVGSSWGEGFAPRAFLNSVQGLGAGVLIACSLAVCCAVSLTGCASSQQAASNAPAASELAASQENSYEVSVPSDVASLVQQAAAEGDLLPADLAFLDDVADGAAVRSAILQEATMTPAMAAYLAEDLTIALDDAARTVTIKAQVPSSAPLADACMAGEALAYLTSACSQVSLDGQPVSEAAFAQSPGVLWDAYTCRVLLDNEEGTLDLDGLKTPDMNAIVWQ